MACGQDIAHAAPEQAPAAAEVATLLRRLIRASDLQSRRIERTTGLTGPQAAVLRAVETLGHGATRALADEVSLSQATVTSIVDRLEKKEYVGRERSKQDKRKVLAFITDTGLDKLKTAPTLLQESFIRQFKYLQEWEQTMIISALQRVAQMMDAQHIDASPFLDVGALDRQTEQRTPPPYDEK